ncbi:MAG: sulfite exporter TauE/SafE family protein [Candidatus Cloacimonetes bacterium]|nr:sulfite exporter TauE/SafE family protein [Candidatus Cloacimonadota bacterium]MCF7815048.1 sulfite exporter TauE/SafE family protein [Candidatus Cloacimonadota bacterium]MCF7868374.1 sulfite exporter TauE/SafE family protein [Candidatus Cloacimonadota bacterium]MCF7883860.1 sulfite exporter TauE/SafE family protein [Candidatus Cloacimonadota bacterium]
MFQILAKGFTLGLTLGTTCLATCTPIYLPYLISEDRKMGKSIITVLEISAGRFFSYLAFGAIAGFTGSQISAIDRELFTAIAYILLSFYLILSAVRTHQKTRHCNIPKMTQLTKSAFILGILTGINFCPSFLIALSNAIDLGGAIDGMLLFFGFFVGTSLYLFPLAFIGQLSKVEIMKLIAQIASILVAIYFIYDGATKLNHYFEHKKMEDVPSRIVEAFHPKIPIIVFSNEENFDYFSTVRDSADSRHPLDVQAYVYQESIIDTLTSENHVLLIDSELLKDKQKEKELDGFDYFYIEPNYPIDKLMHFLKYYSFKTSKNVHFEFKEK